MNRKEFIQLCSGSCLGLLGISLASEGCTSTHYVQAFPNNDRLTIAKSEFELMKKGKLKYRKYIIVRLEKTEHPIVVYRFAENNYKAFVMRCTHQGVELSVNGDVLSCSAHGSEFSNKGEVLQGPAEKPLTAIEVTEQDSSIYLHLF